MDPSNINRSDGNLDETPGQGPAKGALRIQEAAELEITLGNMDPQHPAGDTVADSDLASAQGIAGPRTAGDTSGRVKVREDQRLVERCLADDEPAWEQLYRECHPQLLRAIKLLLGRDAGDAHLVDEMAARVWYTLLRNGGRLLASYDAERDARLGAFLMGLARIEIMRHMRSERRRRSYEFLGGQQALAEGRIPDWQVITMMDEFSSTLTPQEKRFMEQFLLDDPEMETGADVEELSASSIWQRRHRIRRKLKAFFED